MRSIKYCLNKQLSDICQRSIQLEELSAKITQLLPPPLATSCHVGSFTKGCLVLTTSAAWASLLRFALPELRDKLRKEAGMYQLSSINISVIEPNLESKKTKKTSANALSAKAKANIISEGSKCSYKPLRKALLELANDNELEETE